MPEYLAPGVYVEETSFRAKSIEGVSTTTTGFVGPARFGPTDIEPELLTSLLEFERTYGDRLQLKYNGETNLTHNYLWHAVRAFFEEGGSRLYVSRVFQPKDGKTENDSCANSKVPSAKPAPPDPVSLPTTPVNGKKITLKARYPEAVDTFEVRFSLALGDNVFSIDASKKASVAAGLGNSDVVLITRTFPTPSGQKINELFTSAYPPLDNFWQSEANPLSNVGFFIALDKGADQWSFETTQPDKSILLNGNNDVPATPVEGLNDYGSEIKILPVKLAVIITKNGKIQDAQTVSLDLKNTASIFDQFSSNQQNTSPLVIEGTNLKTGLDILHVLNQASDKVSKQADEKKRELLTTLVTRVNEVSAEKRSNFLTVTLKKFEESKCLLTVRTRFPGDAGNYFRVCFTLRLGQNIFSAPEDDKDKTKNKAFVAGLSEEDVVLITTTDDKFPAFNVSQPSIPPIPSDNPIHRFFIAQFDNKTQDWGFKTGTAEPVWLNKIGIENNDDKTNNNLKIRIVTLAITVIREDGGTQVWEGLPLDPNHRRGQTPDSVFAKFSEKPSNIADERQLPIVIINGEKEEQGNEAATGLDVLNILASENNSLLSSLVKDKSNEDERSVTVKLEGGNDGGQPGDSTYKGEVRDEDERKTGLVAFEDLEDISIVAAPGSTQGLKDDPKRAQAIMLALISHAERMRYRIAILDSGDGQLISEVRALRAKLDSKYAALYFPWIKVLDPVTRTEIALPPSGFVAGIYARNDKERAVYKAPANEVVRGALSFEMMLNKSQQEVLNPEGINCFRFFEGRGMRLWGARTISSDPEWKYVNLRRYFAYLERSIDKGTQWAVFEPNGDQLWANVRRTISDFLFNEWQNGALLGDKPEKSYFVKCDRSTMSQNDLDNGRLICLIGVAPLRPAEFVIFRIGQWTADRKG